MNKKEINLETSLIPWHDLQRFFANGSVIKIDLSLDLVDTAYQFSIDNENQVEQWINENKIAPVSDQQALDWYENNREVWAVVVKPWILVQQQNHE